MMCQLMDMDERKYQEVDNEADDFGQKILVGESSSSSTELPAPDTTTQSECGDDDDNGNDDVLPETRFYG